MWGRGGGGGKKVSLLFLSPGCGSIKSIWGANSCQSLNPISLRGQPEVDKNSSGIEVGSTGGQKGHNNGLGGGWGGSSKPSNTHTHTPPSNLRNVLTLPTVSLALALCHHSRGKFHRPFDSAALKSVSLSSSRTRLQSPEQFSL